MTRHRTRSAVAAILFLLASSASGDDSAGGILVRYSFDDELTETGPDTFRVFANAKGKVQLSRSYRLSGDFSVEIRDAAGDGNFPELQGYFPAITKGTLFAHFALLVATPREEFNVALAGPAWFRLAKNGIAFWLKGKDGFLFHVSDSIPKKLCALEAFTWYAFDVTYRVDRGTYDLTIRKEGDTAPVVSLAGQPNAASQPGSAVDKFSFVGDVENDASEVEYYVDDVVIGTDQRIPVLPFTAPGRRTLFVESLLRSRSFLEGRPACLPLAEPRDLGFEPADVAALRAAGSIDLFRALIHGGPSPRTTPPDTLPSRARDLLEAAGDWREGCRAFSAGEPGGALRFFESAAAKSSGRMYRLSSALALAALGRSSEADEILAAVAAEWAGDARYTLALAAVGAARGDLLRSGELLRSPAEKLLGDPAGACSAGSRMLAEEYFATLLLNGFPAAAAAYADEMVAHLAASGQATAGWLERRGDAAFFARDLPGAAGFYEACLPEAPVVLLKLADIRFLEGDVAAERALRERVYGSLKNR